MSIENYVVECDGPPLAYFEVWADDSKEFPIRIKYHTIQYKSKNKILVVEAMETAIDNIKTILVKTAESKMPIIWWRHRPEYTIVKIKNKTMFEAYCRVATTPFISCEFWKDIEVSEDKLSCLVE